MEIASHLPLLLGAVVSASVIGSMHCVGMCGPLALWASGLAEREARSTVWMATSLYHVGRFLTYVLVGVVAGVLGQLVDSGGHALGFQLVAARLAGGLMLVFGVIAFARAMGWSFPGNGSGNASQPNWITKSLVKLRPYIVRTPVQIRGLLTGLLTALLPCGWLYLFALVAAGTGSAFAGALVMAAFWIGTVPALVALVGGTQWLAKRFRLAVPALAAVFLVLTGGFMMAGRGFARLTSLNDIVAGKADFEIGVSPSVVGKVQGDAADGSVDVEKMLTDFDQLMQSDLPCCESAGE